MNLEEIKRKVNSEEYGFLRTNEHLGKRIIMLTLGGSHAYGTEVESSDLDIRGCALNTKRELLTKQNFEQFIDNPTDTTIYSFNKLLDLLSGCNPNVIELLGNKPEHYLYLSPIGRELVRNRKIFLSKKAAVTFGGYATAQLRRLDNKAVRTVNQTERERHILNSIKNAYHTFPEKYQFFDEDSIKLYIGESAQEEYETEIFMDLNLSGYPLRDWKGMWSEMHNIVKDYSKIGKRNKNAIEHDKLGKHMMHLIRLYLMCLDILEKGEIITYRPERDFLMGIRNGEYLDGDNQPIPEFYEMVDDFEKRLKYATENSSLPDKPDYKEIENFRFFINQGVVFDAV